MAPPPPTPASVMGLLGTGRSADARRELAALVRARPRDAQTWLCAAWIEHDARNIAPMRAAAERAAKLGAPGYLVDILMAVAANALGEMDEAITRAERATRTAQGANRQLALAVLAESLYFANRVDDLATLLQSDAEFRADPRGQLLLSRVHRRQGRLEESEAVLRAVVASGASVRVRQSAGSELAKLLDSMHRYAEAFAAAKAMHAATG
ncbi:MAG: hypothetical protein JNK53_04585, partial [Phycisphaerae bacterium]|nr:hypothetical protein [Phycisphaerae bacterium]